jgi:hypothetical protein
MPFCSSRFPFLPIAHFTRYYVLPYLSYVFCLPCSLLSPFSIPFSLLSSVSSA